MRSLIVTIFGIYMPIETIIEVDSEGLPIYGVASGMAGVDWTYIAGVILFAIVLYGFCRLVGVLLK
ncbi:MAG: hypothetical protein GXY86_03070 [Firmicutes bacterium]|nr:hypothetical protein [Bacillota bacterium]